MSIKIYFKDGQIDTWEESDYTDYMYYGTYPSLFVVINELQWVGMYSMDEIRKIVVC